MHKVTTIIFLSCIFLLGSIKISSQNPDIDLLQSINHTPSGFLRGYSKFISNTTTEVGAAAPVILGVVGYFKKDDEMFKNAIYTGVALAFDVAVTYGIKSAVNRPRPYITYPDLIDPQELLSSKSFPSGHTSYAFTAATAISLKYPKWYIIAPSYLWACSVGYSRMNLGVHYPSDVAAGALLGIGSAYITSKVNDWFWKKQNNKKLIGLQAYR